MRYLPLLIQVALALYALIDAIQADESRIRHLPRVGWIALVVLVPFVGPLAWLIAGRPARSVGPVKAALDRPPAPAPDDDPEFLRRLDREVRDREERRRWEENRGPGEGDDGNPPASPQG